MISEKRTYIYLCLAVSVNHASFEWRTIPLSKSNILSSASGEPCGNQEEVHHEKLARMWFPCVVTRDCVLMLVK